ncbi:MAG TPA: selenium-binding protein SBP56-related protein [Chloroflexota bacterium]
MAVSFTPDPTFFPSPRLAAQAPPEALAYVAGFNRVQQRPDFIAVVDVNPDSATYSQVVGRVDLPYVGDELHHFGWNACSSALCPYARPHLERRYLIVPGLRSSRIYVIDTKPDPRRPSLAKVIEGAEVTRRSGYTRLHTVHCGPDALYISALGNAEGGGPGGVLLLDHDTFEVLGRWEVDRGPQHFAYDFFWHLAQDVAVSSEWGTPDMIEGGLRLDDLLNKRFGHRIHFWDLRRRRHVAALDLGEENQMVLELRPAHDPTKLYGFVNVTVNLNNLSSGVWVWYRENGAWRIQRVIEIPAVPADASTLPPALKDVGVVPPLVTDIDLSVDDRFLYVSCWGTGELHQYDVTDPFKPQLTGVVKLGGILHRAAHPNGTPLNGAPQMVEVSRDGKRVYVTNSLYGSWDDQFYPEGIRGWLAKLNADPQGGLRVDPEFLVDFGEERVHQVRLQGGDASSDSYCYP